MTEYREYINRKIVKESEKAFLVEQEVNNRRDGWHTNFRWVAKKICKPVDIEGYVAVPEWAVSNGVWSIIALSVGGQTVKGGKNEGKIQEM